MSILQGSMASVQKRSIRPFGRNKQRFPPDFAFQLSKEEFDHLRSQIVTPSPAMANLRSQIVIQVYMAAALPSLTTL